MMELSLLYHRYSGYQLGIMAGLYLAAANGLIYLSVSQDSF